MENLSDDLIRESIEEIELIDSLLPRELPKYINYKWSSESVNSHYKLKLAEAGELRRVIDKVSKDQNTGPLEIEF
jgi:hypothetical protein